MPLLCRRTLTQAHLEHQAVTIFFCFCKAPEIYYRSIKNDAAFQHDIQFKTVQVSQPCAEKKTSKNQATKHVVP